MEYFTPPYPKPRKGKISPVNLLIRRLMGGWNSHLDLLPEDSYRTNILLIKLFKLRLFIINQSDLVKKVLKTNWEDFPKHPIVLGLIRPILGNGLFSIDGKQWEHQRRMMDSGFTASRLKDCFPLMSAATIDMVDRFQLHKEGMPVNIDTQMMHAATDIIFRALISHPLSQQDAENIHATIKEFQRCLQRQRTLSLYRLPTFYYRRKGKEAAGRIRAILEQIIEPRYHSYPRGAPQTHPDMLDAFMKARQTDTGKSFSYEELVSHIFTLIYAGHDTTATSLIWSLYLIASCPHTQKSLQDEIDAIKNEQPTFDDIKSLNFTRNVFREALRLYPPAAFIMRKSVKEHCALDETIKAGDTILISPWLIHRHREQWKDPDLFKPGRFEDPDSKESIRCSYIPFGSGPRICIAQMFSYQAAVLVLATLVRNFEFSPVPGFIVEPVSYSITHSKNGLKLIMRRRKNKKER